VRHLIAGQRYLCGLGDYPATTPLPGSVINQYWACPRRSARPARKPGPRAR
jgi:hypothetical protein